MNFEAKPECLDDSAVKISSNSSDIYAVCYPIFFVDSAIYLRNNASFMNSKIVAVSSIQILGHPAIERDILFDFGESPLLASSLVSSSIYLFENYLNAMGPRV